MVLDSVKPKSVGWHRVFPNGVPRWASKVRNYFNETPQWLKLLDKKQSAQYLARAQKYIRDPKNVNVRVPVQIPDHLEHAEHWGKLYLTSKALSGDAYVDDASRIWYQMSPGSTVYHFESSKPEQIINPALDLKEIQAIWASVRTQNLLPVFKLVSPDGTGGSRECIINSPIIARVKPSPTIPVYLNLRAATIGTGNLVDVRNRINTHLVFRGSYNYSERRRRALTHPTH